MNYLLIISAVAAGWCMHIIFNNFFCDYYDDYYDDYCDNSDLTDEEKDEIIESVDREMLITINKLVVAVEYACTQLADIQKYLPKEVQLSKSQWLEKAMTFADINTKENNDE